jgi:cold shock CspA family protein
MRSAIYVMGFKMEKRVVAYGIADSYNKPPTVSRDHRPPTYNSRREIEAQIIAFNRRQGAERYAFAKIFEDGTFEASYSPVEVGGWTVGIVKWFSVAKGFGFIVTGEGQPDVFIHQTTLDAAKVTDLQPGEPVSIRFGRTEKGLVATAIERAAP